MIREFAAGVATPLCVTVPLGAVITMPAAVAGSTMRARALTERAAIGSTTEAAPGA